MSLLNTESFKWFSVFLLILTSSALEVQMEKTPPEPLKHLIISRPIQYNLVIVKYRKSSLLYLQCHS